MIETTLFAVLAMATLSQVPRLQPVPVTETSTSTRIICGLERDLTRDYRRCDAAYDILDEKFDRCQRDLALTGKLVASQERVNVLQAAETQALDLQALGIIGGVSALLGGLITAALIAAL